MLIIGTGAVATMLTERLVHSGGLQIFGSRSARSDALNQRFNGIVTVHPDEIAQHDLWVVAVKTGQNRAKVELLSDAPRPRSILVLQNGLAPQNDWRGMATETVERGLSTYGVRSLGPGWIAGGEHGVITLAAGSGFTDRLLTAGFNVSEAMSLERDVWHKLAVNASLNVVASLFDLSNGGVLRDQRARRLMRQAASEVAEVARAAGIEWGALSAWEIARSVARATADNICSTLADLRLGRPTEYDSINGEVLEWARRLGVETPTLSSLDREFRALPFTLSQRGAQSA